MVITTETMDGRELKVIVRALGYEPTKEEIKEMIALADSDGNEQLDRYELLEIMEEKWVISYDWKQFSVYFSNVC